MRNYSIWTERRGLNPELHEHRHALERGRIWCPLHERRDVDIHDCLSCRWLVAARIEGTDRWVRCAPPARPAMQLPVLQPGPL